MRRPRWARAAVRAPLVRAVRRGARRRFRVALARTRTRRARVNARTALPAFIASRGRPTLLGRRARPVGTVPETPRMPTRTCARKARSERRRTAKPSSTVPRAPPESTALRPGFRVRSVTVMWDTTAPAARRHRGPRGSAVTSAPAVRFVLLGPQMPFHARLDRTATVPASVR